MPLQYRKGTCTQCGADDVMIVKRMSSGNYCNGCNQKRLGARPEKVNYKDKVVHEKKPKLQLLLFTAIWNGLKEKKCEVCGDHVEFAPITFSHILGKGAYPAFKLLKENILPMCPSCHVGWDTIAKSELVGDGWDRIKVRAQELKQRYYQIKD